MTVDQVNEAEHLPSARTASLGASLFFLWPRAIKDGPALVPDDLIDSPPLPPPRLFERLCQITGYSWDESTPPLSYRPSAQMRTYI
ncbi:hypothetical protein GGI42DRAFT_89893 [Trichoderma sp. SZMC 28013]